MRAEALGFIRHAKLMLGNAVVKIKEEWDDPEVSLTPSQTSDMRRELREISRLMKEIEPFAKEFEKVTEVRLNPSIPTT